MPLESGENVSVPGGKIIMLLCTYSKSAFSSCLSEENSLSNFSSPHRANPSAGFVTLFLVGFFNACLEVKYKSSSFVRRWRNSLNWRTCPLYHSLSIKSKSCTTLASVCGFAALPHLCPPGSWIGLFSSNSTSLVCLPRLSCSPANHRLTISGSCTPKPADASHSPTHLHAQHSPLFSDPWADSVPASSRTHTHKELGAPASFLWWTGWVVGTYVMLKCVIRSCSSWSPISRQRGTP